MGCNCKNNSGTLAWVVGNDVLLKLWLWEKTATKEYKQTTLPFPLEEATELVVVARADYGKEYSLSFSLLIGRAHVGTCRRCKGGLW